MADLNPLLHTWSLSLEEQFYIVFPAIVALSTRLRKHRCTSTGAIARVIAVLSLGSPVLCLVFSYGTVGSISREASEKLAFSMLPSRASQFGAGALAGLIGGREGRNLSVRAVLALATLGRR